MSLWDWAYFTGSLRTGPVSVRYDRRAHFLSMSHAETDYTESPDDGHLNVYGAFKTLISPLSGTNFSRRSRIVLIERILAVLPPKKENRKGEKGVCEGKRKEV